MTRNGKAMNALEPGAKRRLYDARNAWRKMIPEQRHAMLEFICGECDIEGGAELPPGWKLIYTGDNDSFEAEGDG